MSNNNNIERLAAKLGKVPVAGRARHFTSREWHFLNKLTHEVANQLTVLHLSCCKLRHALPGSDQHLLKELNNIEAAVEQSAQLIEMLRASSKTGTPGHQPRAVALTSRGKTMRSRPN
jgi:hypothetical protein